MHNIYIYQFAGYLQPKDADIAGGQAKLETRNKSVESLFGQWQVVVPGQYQLPSLKQTWHL